MPNQAVTAEWTIMVYIAADSVLANFAIESLKQLKMAAGKDIVVAAQVDLDGAAHTRRIRRFIFDGSGSKEGSIFDDCVRCPDITSAMTAPNTLRDFIDWSYKQRRCDAKHHCLVIDGHGPSLLEDAEVAAVESMHGDRAQEDGPKLLYMTPVDLGQALRDAELGPLQKRKKLDIVGLNACSMAMIEVAREIQEYTHFLVASQEEVPDAGFPYGRLLPLFRRTPGNVAAICRSGAQDYKQNYKDYVFTQRTGMKKCTISSLSTHYMSAVLKPLKQLAELLLQAANDAELRSKIRLARENAKGFVGGIYVDLYDFCDILFKHLHPGDGSPELRAACREVREALAQGNDAFVLENQALDPAYCHGVSIYFPYLTDEEKAVIERTPVKGSLDRPIRGSLDRPIKDGTDVAGRLRREAIEQIEQHFYPKLKFSNDTHWDEFIAHGWSRILAEESPHDIDIRYSAKQCALNLLNLYQKGKATPKRSRSRGAAA